MFSDVKVGCLAAGMQPRQHCSGADRRRCPWAWWAYLDPTFITTEYAKQLIEAGHTAHS